jgi:methyltransferase (TIGR00027 family)
MSRTGSARFDGDTWDLASSVGATATMVAAARAMASKADHPLIDDPFAEPLVRAVGVDFFTRLVTGDLRPEDLDSDSESVGMQRMTDNMAVRTKFFDDFFLTATGGGNSADATTGGIRQAVILASGLDSRAYRLAWPAGTTVYEIDQPEVIEFKTRTLAELGAEPTARRRTVAMDLRYDWPSALIEEGFDPNQPTAWSAEGLLGYLPPDAQDRLLDTITELSAPGSQVAVESVPNIDPADHEKVIERMKSASERWRDHGFNLDFAELVYLGDRNEAASYLSDHGWQLSRSSVKELFAANGLPPLDEDNEDVGNFAELQYVSGVLNGAQR